MASVAGHTAAASIAGGTALRHDGRPLRTAFGLRSLNGSVWGTGASQRGTMTGILRSTTSARTRLRRLTFLPALLASFLLLVASASGTVTEFSEGITSSTKGITAGPDGNLWFTGANYVGRFTPTGTVTEFTVAPLTGEAPSAITAGPDGNLWFTESGEFGPRIGRITPTGTITEFSLENGAHPIGITAGPDGNLWFTTGRPSIGRITPTGTITEFSLLSEDSPIGITAGPDGNLWFTEPSEIAGRIGRITPTGTITEFSEGITSHTEGITAGPDGNLWFTESYPDQIGRITPTGAVTEFTEGITQSSSGTPFIRDPFGIAAGPDGNLWFTEPSGDQIGRITPTGTITEFSGGITQDSYPFGIAAGPDGNLWFTELGGFRIGRIDAGPFAPTVRTQAASSITQTSATLNGTVNPNGWEVGACKFDYGPTTGYGSSAPCTPSPGSGESSVAVSASIGGLSANSEYHFRIVATNANGTSKGADRSFKTQPNPPNPPSITKLKPKLGPVTGGTTVTITGTNLTGAIEVRFGSVNAASFTVNSSTSITAVSPAEAAGTVDVTVTTPGGTSVISKVDRFKFLPVVTGVSPNAGPAAGGTSVTVSGAGFALGTTATKFKFGKTKATSLNCTSSTECTVVAPAHAAGTVDVRATVNKVTSAKTPADQFTYS
jgi:streptogramin lyase